MTAAAAPIETTGVESLQEGLRLVRMFGEIYGYL